MLPRRMVQSEGRWDRARGCFVLSSAGKRSRWIKYAGKSWGRVCVFCKHGMEPGDWYYASRVEGTVCATHAKVYFNATPPASG